MGKPELSLLKSVSSLEEQGILSKDTSHKLRRLLKKVDRATARKDRTKVNELVAEICSIILISQKIR